MALEVIGVIGALIMPVYAALWKINRNIGRLSNMTEHNRQAFERLSETVSELDSRATRVDTRENVLNWKDGISSETADS